MGERRRDVLPDVLKGFGAVLVVLGHCIQSGSGQAYLENECYFNDSLYRFIYSFHMPLFMIISGWYAWPGVRDAETPEERIRMIGRKCVYLLVPIVAWKLIEFAYLLAAGAYLYRGPGVLLKDAVLGILTNFWFLWAILYSFLLVCLMHYRLRDSVWLYALIFAAMFITPDGLGLNAYKYMLPYYLIGFYVNKNKERLLSKKLFREILREDRGRCALTILASGLVFFSLVSLFTADSFIYLTGYKLIGKDYIVQLRIDGYRFLVGLCGIVFWFFVWRALLRLCGEQSRGVRAVAYLGRRGFGVYMISGILIPYVLSPVSRNWEPRYGVNLAETAIVLAVSAAVVELLRRIPRACRLVGEGHAKPIHK
ncbi:MAG: acyltransferase family protein [Roseburia sp.]|nr:acyltransferase family protein [Roseburia sp.]